MERGANMEAIINDLLEADAAAQAKLLEAQLRRQQMADTMAQVREDIQRDYADRAQKRIDDLRAQRKREYDDSVQKLNAAYQAALGDLKQNYDAHKEEWVETLVARCLN